MFEDAAKRNVRQDLVCSTDLCCLLAQDSGSAQRIGSPSMRRSARFAGADVPAYRESRHVPAFFPRDRRAKILPGKAFLRNSLHWDKTPHRSDFDLPRRVPHAEAFAVLLLGYTCSP